MVTKITQQTYDDLTGEPGAVAFTFSLNATSYEIDLANEGQALRDALAPFIAAAHKPYRFGKPAASTNRASLATMRQWAAANGFQPAARGRLSQEIQDAYASRKK